jgi:hypothetical protein
LESAGAEVKVDAIYAHLAAKFRLGVKWWEVEGRNPTKISGLYPPHGFFGASKYWGENWHTRRGTEVCCSGEDPSYSADPVDVEALEDWYIALIRSCRSLSTLPVKSPLLIHASHLTTDCFSQLPSELLYKILSYLPLPCVTSARLASRDMAALPLDTAFWRTRVLLPTVDIPWLWDMDLSERSWEVGEEAGVEWKVCLKTLVEATPQQLLNKDEPIGLRSRRRIWRSIAACWETE